MTCEFMRFYHVRDSWMNVYGALVESYKQKET